ncbi:ZIP family metal transporter [Novosphingobium terrae]|uniref:ZIP family metal transporter n=1 Tax=Novosphingobium terrae TaxID=2726189 RepID=UPI001980094B|nr:hypothetical protein [Novosphingobium terrae]
MISAWPPLLGALAGCSAFAGGQLVLRMPTKVGLFQALAAGMVMGAALFDLLPEALALHGHVALWPLLITAAVLVTCVLLARLGQRRMTGRQTSLIPAFLVLHSLMDGASIALAFQLTSAAGWMVALAILAHDLADGVNIVSISAGRGRARLWLVLNALAPLIGALLGGSLDLPAPVLCVLLAGMGGIFLFIAAFHLIPDSLERCPAWATSLLAATGLLGMGAITYLIGLAGAS